MNTGKSAKVAGLATAGRSMAVIACVATAVALMCGALVGMTDAAFAEEPDWVYAPLAVQDDEMVQVVHGGTEDDLSEFLKDVSGDAVLEYDSAEPDGSSPEIVRYALGGGSSYLKYGVGSNIVHDDPLGYISEESRMADGMDGDGFDRVLEVLFNVDPAYVESAKAAPHRFDDGFWWYYKDGTYYYGQDLSVAEAQQQKYNSLPITVEPMYRVDILSLERRDDGAYDVTYDFVRNWTNENVRRYAVVSLGDSLKGMKVYLPFGGVHTWPQCWTLLKNSASPITSGQASRAYMYRLYNPFSGEHFYTANPDEKCSVANSGWNDEDLGWTAPATSGTPVYRLYNSYAGEHHYTLDERERDALIAAGWEDEGIGWYSDDAQTVPLFREYNPNEPANNHNYTTDAAEHAMLVALGWVDEGIAWYGM